MQLRSTPLNRVTSVRGHFAPIKRRKYFILASMYESYSGLAKVARLSGVDCIKIRAVVDLPENGCYPHLDVGKVVI